MQIMVDVLVAILCIAGGFFLVLAIIYGCLELFTSKKLATFYQIWLVGEELTANFLVMSGYETKNYLITDNNLKLHKSKYYYAVLPFCNYTITQYDISKMSETEYLKLCNKLTMEMTPNEQEDDE